MRTKKKPNRRAEKRPNRRASVRAGALLAAALLLAAGCGGGTPGTVEVAADAAGVRAAAAKEGRLVFYSAYNAELTQALADAFEQKHKIRVETVRQASADLNARYAAEAGAGAVNADVLWQPDSVFAEAAAKKGWLGELDARRVPNLDRVEVKEPVKTYVPVLEQPWGIAYNTKLVQKGDVPRSWRELAQGKRVEGGLLVAAPRNSVATAGVYNFWLNTFGEGYFDNLRRTQGYAMGDSVSNAIQQVSAGEVGAFVPAPMSTVATAKKAGAPVEVVVPDETTGFAMLASVSEAAAHRNAARLFVDFLLSPEGQEIAVGDIAVPVVRGVRGGVPRPARYVASDNGQTTERLDKLVDLVEP